MTYWTVGFQAAVSVILGGLAYGLGGGLQQAAAVFCGGLISAMNGAMLAWRMFRAAAREVQHTDDAHRQLRLMYFYAAERFLAVAVLLGMCMAFLKGWELAVLVGFVAGQTAMLVARLFWNREAEFYN